MARTRQIDHKQLADRMDRLRRSIACLRRHSGRPEGTAGTLEMLVAECQAIVGQLAESEQHYRAMLEHNPDAVFFVDLEGRLTAVNTALERPSGYSEDELLEMKWMDLCAPDRLADAVDHFKRSLQGHPISLDTTMIRKDGQRVELLLSGGPVVADGRAVGAFGMARDITSHTEARQEILGLNVELEERVSERTARLNAANRKLRAEIAERKRTEAALHESEEKYRLLVESAGEVICCIDEKGVFLFANEQAARMLGSKPTDLIGRTFWDLFPKEIADRYSAIVGKVLRTGNAAVVESREGTAEETRWYRTSLVPFKTNAGKPAGVLAIARNVTDQKQLEERIEESEHRFRSIFENAADGILLANIESKRFYGGNPMICRMLGYDQDEIRALGVADIHPEEDLPHVTDVFVSQARGECALAEEIPVKRKDGSVFYADVSSFPITLNGNGYLVRVFRDVTERRRADEQIRRYQERLRALASDLSLAEERERRRLTVDLHDGLAPLLVLATIKLTAARQSTTAPKLAASLREVEQLIRRTIKMEGSLTCQLCPPVLYEFGFVAAAK